MMTGLQALSYRISRDTLTAPTLSLGPTGPMDRVATAAFSPLYGSVLPVGNYY